MRGNLKLAKCGIFPIRNWNVERWWQPLLDGYTERMKHSVNNCIRMRLLGPKEN
jgi:hypothetical protein